MDPPELASEPPRSRFGAALNSALHLTPLGRLMLGGIQGAIHPPTIKHLTYFKIPQNKIHKLMKAFSQIAIQLVTHIILHKQKFEIKIKILILLD